jgi:hypothetical protein
MTCAAALLMQVLIRWHSIFVEAYSHLLVDLRFYCLSDEGYSSVTYDAMQFGSLLRKFWGSLMFLDKREATSFSRTLVTYYQPTLCYIPDNLTPA